MVENKNQRKRMLRTATGDDYTGHLTRSLPSRNNVVFSCCVYVVCFFVVPRIKRGVFVGPRPGRGKPIRPRSKSPTSVQYISEKKPDGFVLSFVVKNETHWILAEKYIDTGVKQVTINLKKNRN